jgi:thiamine-monophosphate kinase
MSLGEFDLISKYFDRPVRRAALGVGDDCALLQPTPGMQWAVSCDALVEGRHFLSTVPPQRLGHKALAVNLSDLAACGAAPVAFTLALTMPRVDEAWLQGVSAGLFALADRHGIELVGGDTTSGPVHLALTVFGEVPAGQALLRSGARAGDDLYVSGVLGDARLALEAFRGRVSLRGPHFEQVRRTMEQPEPRVALGLALRGVASSAIDVSDGLVGDLRHVLKRSGVGATLQLDRLPRSDVLASQPDAMQVECLLCGGDDYELLFTAPPEQRDEVQRAGVASGVPVTRIGQIEAGDHLRVLDRQGQALDAAAGFDHFR